LNEKAPIFLDSPVQFSDRWSGKITGLEVDESWEIINLFVTAGLFRARTVKLPMTSATWDAEHVAFPEVTASQAFNRELPPVAAPARPVNAETAVSLPETQLAGGIVERVSNRAVEVLFTRPAGMFRLPADEVSFQGTDIRITAQTDTLMPYRSDNELLRLAREGLARAQRLTSEERRAITIVTSDKEVTLAGNVLTAHSREFAVQAVTVAVAPAPVRDVIADDLGLEFEVGRALQRTGVSRGATVHPRARLGNVTLYGFATTAAAATEAERVASLVPGVRSVESRVEVAA
jgi:osmotically-inducible protein OsmY